MTLTTIRNFIGVRLFMKARLGALLLLLGALAQPALAQRQDGLALDGEAARLFDSLLTDCFNQSEGGGTSPGCNALFGLVFPPTQGPADGAAIADAMEQILPNQIPVQALTAFFQQDQLSALRERLLQVRKGQGRGVTVMGMPLYDKTAARAQRSGAGSAGDDAFADTPWGFFLSGRYQNGDVDSRGVQDGFDFDVQGLTAGVDYRVNDTLVIGGSLGYGASTSKIDQHRGKVDLDNWTGWFYGNYFPGEHVYFDWSLGYGRNKYDGNRNLQFGSLITRTDYNTDGHQYNLSLGTGYDVSHDAWQCGGYLHLDAMHTTIDSYREKGGGGLALDMHEQNAHSLESTLGVRTSRAISFSGGVLLPGIDVGYVHQWQDDARNITAGLAELPELGTFTVRTRELDRNYFNIGLNLTGTFTGGQSGYIRYQTIAGREEVNQNTFEVGYRMEF